MGVKRRRCRDCVRIDAFFFRNSLVHGRDLDVTTGVTGEVTVEVTDCAAAAPSDVVVGVEISVAEALASGGGGGAEVSDGVGVAVGSGVGVTGGFVGGRGGSEENQSITVCAFQVGM